MAFTVPEVVDRFRNDVDDLVLDPLDESDVLFPTSDVLDYLTQAQREFCRRTNFYTSDVTVAVTADDRWVTLPETTIKVRAAWMESENRHMRILNGHDDQAYTVKDYGFQVREVFDTSPGIPKVVRLDLIMHRGELSPIPVADDNLILNCVSDAPRVTQDNYDTAASLFITNEQYVVEAILPYMKYLAYSTQDADSYRAEEAEKYKARAEVHMLRAASHVRKTRRQPGTTGYGGIPM